MMMIFDLVCVVFLLVIAFYLGVKVGFLHNILKELGICESDKDKGC